MEPRFRHSLAAVCLVFAPALAIAQEPTIVEGRITGEAGAPLPNAFVAIRELRLQAISSQEGRYTIRVPAAQADGRIVTLSARLLGYREAVARIRLTTGRVVQDLALEPVPTQLSGVIVVAEGQVKEKSQLGTAAQQVSAEQLNAAHTDNFLSQLGAKVSGLNITSPGTQGGSVKLTIRGSNSIAGNNDPLFVIDGVPVSNQNRGGDPDGGWDYGSTISDLNADDIASITVLKGPNAAALYGSSAANGAIVITTKHGQHTDGKIQATLTTSYSVDKVGILPDFQNQYGQGAGGRFRYVDGAGSGINDGADQSWGPKFDPKTLIDQFTGPNQPWVAHPDNVESFFNTGGTFDANLAVSGGSENANARLSVGVQNVSGIIPNNYLHKWSSTIAGNMKVGRRFDASASLHFIRNNGLNRPGVGYNAGILEGLTVWFGRQVDMKALKDHYKDYDQFGNHYNWNSNYHSNPYWLQYENPQRDIRDQYIGSLQGTYHVFDWLDLTGRFGGNVTRFMTEQDVAPGNTSWQGYGIEDPAYNGAFTLFNNNESNYTAELLVNATRQLTSKLQMNGLLGFAKQRDTYNSQYQATTGLLVAGVYNVSNAAVAPTLTQTARRWQKNSVFGSASFTWNGWWTVEGTARNDWSSTLPKGNNSYFYPSVNTSLVLTDAIPDLKSRVLSYAKLRGSLARVGNDASPYQLVTTYQGLSEKFGGIPQYTLSNTLANAQLKPEITKAAEVGFELGFLGDRVSLDASYYRKSTTNQIFDITISPTTGFSSKAINAGNVVNKGVEALLTVTPIRTRDGFEWTSTFSFSKNASKVVSLYPGIQTIVLGSSWYTNIEARQGEPYGAIYGNAFLRDSATGQLLLSGGLPQVGPLKVLGNIQPDWTGGWSNTLRYKRLTFSALFDIRQGGDIFSITNYFGAYTGTLAFTMRGREKDWNDPGITLSGIDVATGQPNTTTVTSEQYFQSLFHIAEPFIYKDSYIKLREVRLALDVPPSILDRLRLSSATLALYGRNLWTHTNVPNIDPEFSYSAGNAQGIEFAELPNPRSFGISFQVTP